MKLSEVLDRCTGSGHGTVVLELDLARGLIEVRPSNPLQALRLVGATSVQSVRDNLHQGARDDRVAGLIVHAVPGHQPMAVLDEIGGLIEEFGEHRPTMAWSESFGELDNALAAYKLATAAHTIWLQPTGYVGIGGAELSIVLMKGLFNKAGIEPQFGQRKEYKSAADQYAADHVTDANREMMQRLGQSLVDDAVATISRRRDLAASDVLAAVNDSPVAAGDALERGLVDSLGYRDQAYAAALAQWQAGPEDLRFVSRYEPRRSLARRLAARKAGKVAVVTLRGAIVTGRGKPGGPGGESAGADVVDEHLRSVLRDDDVKSVLFEIDSPGGSAVASDFIRRSVKRVRESGRPVVAQMGTLAASGGYYAAMGCTEVVALPTTLTGSIGVLAGKLVTRGLYEKLGLVREPVRVGQGAGFLSSATEFSDRDWAKLDECLDRIYHDFTHLAAEDRGLRYEELEAVARGRVWTGADALDRRLVDHLGGWRTAWERACALSGLDPDKAVAQRVGHSNLIERFTPATSSESRSAAGVVVEDPVEALFTRAAAWVGLPVPGLLALPWQFQVR